MSENTKQYEISYLLRKEEGKEVIMKALNEIAAVNIAEGGLSEIKLSYPINKQDMAYFGYSIFEAKTESVPKINNILKFSEEILRFFVITPPIKKTINKFFDKKNINEPLSDSSSFEEIPPQEENATQAEKIKLTVLEETETKTDNLPAEENFPPQSSEDKEELKDDPFDEKLKEILTNVS